MSIQTLSPNRMMTTGMDSAQLLRSSAMPQALPLANVLQSAGQLLSSLTPLLLQAAQSTPLAPNALASSLGSVLQGAASMLGSINQLLNSALQQAVPMNGGNALGTLGRYFDAIKGADGMVGARELSNAASSPFAPPDLKSAAGFLLNNPKLLSVLDRADATIRNPGEMADGRISKGDVRTAFQALQSPTALRA